MSLFKKFPALSLSTIGALAILAIQFFVTKEVSFGGALSAAIALFVGGSIHTQVSPVHKVAEAAVNTAKQLTGGTAGAVGEITTGAVSTVTNVVGNVLGTTVEGAGKLVGGILKGVL